MLELDAEIGILRPVEILIAHIFRIERGRGEIPVAVIAGRVRNAALEALRKALRELYVRIGDGVVFAVPFETGEERAVGGRIKSRAETGIYKNIAVAAIIRILLAFRQTVVTVGTDPGTVVELNGRVQIEIENKPHAAVFAGFPERVSHAGSDSAPGIRKVAAAARELVEPFGAAVDRVEIKCAASVLEPRVVRLLHEDIGVRLENMLPLFTYGGGTSRGKRDAALDDRARDIVLAL